MTLRCLTCLRLFTLDTIATDTCPEPPSDRTAPMTHHDQDGHRMPYGEET